MILLSQLNCMNLLAVACLDWKLQLAEGGGRRWPGVSSKLQNSNPGFLHPWNYRSLGTCLIKVFCLFEGVPFFFLQCCWLVRDPSRFDGAGLPSPGVRVRIMEGSLLCLELIWIRGVCVYVNVHVLHFLLRRSQISCHMAWEWGRGAAWGWEAVGINMPKYILTNAFSVPVRIVFFLRWRVAVCCWLERCLWANKSLSSFHLLMWMC